MRTFPSISILLAGLALAGAARATGPTARVNVVVDMTEAGRQVAAPTPEHPVFYVPLVIGYREQGAPVAGNRTPPEETVLKTFAEALAQRGYRVVGPHTPDPTVLLVFCWGTWNPVMAPLNEEEATAESPDVALNAHDLSLLIAGNTARKLARIPDWMMNVERDELLSDLKEDHFFALVAALKWTNERPHPRVLLWTAKMSVDARSLAFDETLPALIKAGAPLFGHETLKRQRVTVPLLPEGRVNLGEMQVQGVVSPDELPATAKQPKEKQP